MMRQIRLSSVADTKARKKTTESWKFGNYLGESFGDNGDALFVGKLFRSLNNEVEQNGKLFTSLHLVIQYLSQSPILTKKNQIVRIEV